VQGYDADGTILYWNKTNEDVYGYTAEEALGKNLVDFIRLPDRYESELRPLIEVEGLEHFDQAYRRGKGVITVTGHIGNFEMLAAYFSALEYRTAAIFREMYDDHLNNILIKRREKAGLTTISTTDSPRVILKWLKDGGVLGVLMDNDSHRVRSVLVPFMGRLANTPIGHIMVGLKTGAAFVPLACLRTPDDRYKIIVRPEIVPIRTEDLEADVLEMTRRCNQELEKIINDHPTQWIWFHNRWHTRPEGQA
jgi:KDO2-lipid IV(A) lauroyltransferase